MLLTNSLALTPLLELSFCSNAVTINLSPLPPLHSTDSHLQRVSRAHDDMMSSTNHAHGETAAPPLTGNPRKGTDRFTKSCEAALPRMAPKQKVRPRTPECTWKRHKCGVLRPAATNENGKRLLSKNDTLSSCNGCPDKRLGSTIN